MNTYGLNESMFINREQYLETIIEKSEEYIKLLEQEYLKATVTPNGKDIFKQIKINGGVI